MSRPADSHGDWVLWRPEGYGRAPLYLAPDLASALDAEHRRGHEEQVAAEREERRQALEEELAAKKAQSRKAPAPGAVVIGPHRPHAYEVQRHTVLPNVDLVVERMGRLRDGLYGDKDVTARELKVLSAALQQGSERSVVRPPKWRQALEDLAGELPAFRAAIEVFAHAFALSEGTLSPPVIPPILLVGPPGVGKSFFCRRLAQTLECGSAWLAMDQPSAGCALRGSDNHWATARHGTLFELLGLGRTANPLVVLDEIDKAARRQAGQDIDSLAQLYSALEPQTARHLADDSLDVELDASQVVYVATANQLRGLDAALLSRFEVISIGLPSPVERRESAARVVASAMRRLGAGALIRVSPGCVALLAEYSPRIIKRAVERAVAAAAAGARHQVTIDDIEVALGLADRQQTARFH